MGLTNILGWIIRLTIASGILYYLFRKIPFSDVIDTIGHTKINYVVSALILSLFLQILLAKQLRFLALRQGISLSTLRLFKINTATVFYGLFLPGGNITALSIRLYKLSGPGREPEAALASLIFDRVWATLALCATGILFWIADWPTSSGEVIFGLLLLMGILVLLVYLLLDGSCMSVLSWLQVIKVGYISKRLMELKKALDRYKGISLRFLVVMFGVSITIHLLGALIYYMLATGIGLAISLTAIGWIRSAVMAICLLPISISGLGLREGALLFFLVPYGISGDMALAFSFLVFSATLLFIGVIGATFEAKGFLGPNVNVKGHPL